jgi:hypothetical protein
VNYDDVAFGGAGKGNSPCTNCEDQPKRDDDLFCSDECRAEYEGEDE